MKIREMIREIEKINSDIIILEEYINKNSSFFYDKEMNFKYKYNFKSDKLMKIF